MTPSSSSLPAAVPPSLGKEERPAKSQLDNTNQAKETPASSLSSSSTFMPSSSSPSSQGSPGAGGTEGKRTQGLADTLNKLLQSLTDHSASENVGRVLQWRVSLFQREVGRDPYPKECKKLFSQVKRAVGAGVTFEDVEGALKEDIAVQRQDYVRSVDPLDCPRVLQMLRRNKERELARQRSKLLSLSQESVQGSDSVSQGEGGDTSGDISPQTVESAGSGISVRKTAKPVEVVEEAGSRREAWPNRRLTLTSRPESRDSRIATTSTPRQATRRPFHVADPEEAELPRENTPLAKRHKPSPQATVVSTSRPGSAAPNAELQWRNRVMAALKNRGPSGSGGFQVTSQPERLPATVTTSQASSSSTVVDPMQVDPKLAVDAPTSALAVDISVAQLGNGFKFRGSQWLPMLVPTRDLEKILTGDTRTTTTTTTTTSTDP